jgi:prepilin signal peptidase PulO-like enzyme (type II secretory pathway)
LVCILFGYVFLVLMISAKYSAYPDEINIPQAILIVLCFCFPPLLIAVIPFLLSQSIKQLNRILK